MIQALLLIFMPTVAWDRVVRHRRSVLFILLIYLIPLIVLTSAAEGYGLYRGKWLGEIAHLKKFTRNEAIVFEAAQFFVTLGIVLLAAYLVKAVGETFHGRHTYGQAFTVVAYGLGPFLLFRGFNFFPGVSPWVWWALGILLSIGALYQGLPRVLEPDPPHAFGLYFMTSLLLLLITGLIQFMTSWFLHGKFVQLEALFSDLARRLPF
jgi:hypothetical protein